MKNSIILAFSIIAATIAPSLLIPETAFAQTGIDFDSCAVLPRKSDATIETPIAPLGTAKDLMLGGPQKVNTQCFFSFAGPDPDAKPSPVSPPIVVKLPKPDRLELILIWF